MSAPLLPPSDSPRGALWADSFSLQPEDGKMDFYFLEDTWKYLGRFYSILEAIDHVPQIEDK